MGKNITANKFNKWTIEKRTGDNISIECKKGLWAVVGHADQYYDILVAAVHYYMQYNEDGEYRGNPDNEQ